MPEEGKKLLSVTQAAERAGVDRSTINRHIRAGTLPAELMGNYYYIDPNILDKWKSSEDFHEGSGRPRKKSSKDPQ